MALPFQNPNFRPAGQTPGFNPLGGGPQASPVITQGQQLNARPTLQGGVGYRKYNHNDRCLSSRKQAEHYQ